MQPNPVFQCLVEDMTLMQNLSVVGHKDNAVISLLAQFSKQVSQHCHLA
jgi:hypothetical protein